MSPSTRIMLSFAAVVASAAIGRYLGYRKAERDLRTDHRIALLRGRVLGLEQIFQDKDAA